MNLKSLLLLTATNSFRKSQGTITDMVWIRLERETYPLNLLRTDRSTRGILHENVVEMGMLDYGYNCLFLSFERTMRVRCQRNLLEQYIESTMP